MLARDALFGARLMIKSDVETIQVLIDAVEEVRPASEEPIILYRLLIKNSAEQGYRDSCQPDALGRRLGLPLIKEGHVTLTCTSGAEGNAF